MGRITVTEDPEVNYDATASVGTQFMLVVLLHIILFACVSKIGDIIHPSRPHMRYWAWKKILRFCSRKNKSHKVRGPSVSQENRSHNDAYIVWVTGLTTTLAAATRKGHKLLDGAHPVAEVEEIQNNDG